MARPHLLFQEGNTRFLQHIPFLGMCFLLLLSVNGLAAPKNDEQVADAAMRADREAVRSLVRQRADVNTPQTDGTTALHWAARWNDLEMADLLIRAGADAKASNRYGVTALTEACTNGSAAMIEKLLKAGANVNAQHEGETSLMTASRTGNVDAIKMLLSYEADINAKESWRGQTALMWAAAEDHADAVKVLIDKGADINARSAVFDFRDLKPKAGSVPMNFPRGGFTPLLFAARQGNIEPVRMLLDAGANVNLADPDNSTPLLVAIINFHYDLASFLIDRGADPNIADNKGRTPLYAAVDMHTLDTSTRPSPKVNDKLGSLDVVKKLLAQGSHANPQLTGIIAPRGVLDGADRTLGPGATPFMRAAKSDDLVIMRLLLDYGADPLLTTKDSTNALMVAAGTGWRDGKSRGGERDAIEAIKICLERGLDINAATDKGETALQGAAGRGADEIIQFLADKGANVQAKDKQQRTALDIALGVGAEVGGVRAPQESTVALLRRLMKN